MKSMGVFLCIIPYLKAWGPCGYPFSSHIDVPSSRLHGWLPYHIPSGMFLSIVGVSQPRGIFRFMGGVCPSPSHIISSPRGCFLRYAG